MPYLTPEAPSGSVVLRALVPDTLVPSAVGALASLWNPHHWEEFGALTIPQTLEYVGGMVTSITEDEPIVITSTALIGAKAKHTGTLWIDPNDWVDIELDTEEFDTDNFHDLVTLTKNFEIPVGKAGYYFVRGYCTAGEQNSAGEARLYLYKNGESLQFVAAQLPATAGHSHSLSNEALLYLAEGDTVNLLGFHNAGVSIPFQNIELFFFLVGT